MGFPNYVDNTFYSVVFTGGDWSLPLANLKNPRLSLPAQSNGVAEANTWFEVDVGSLRDITLSVLPSTNSTLNGQRRLRATDIPAFSNSTVVGSNGSAGASSVVLKAPAGAGIDIDVGDFFTIGGFLYKSNTNVTISAGATDTVNLASASGNDIHYATLQAAVTTDDPVTCNTGDYTTTKYDSGQIDIIGRIYPWGSLPWQHPSYWNGKPTEEDRQTLVFPVLDLMTDSVVIARYFKYEFFDTGNTADGFAISRLFLAPGWQPTINPIYGAGFNYQTDTTFEKSQGGEKSYDEKDPYREMGFSIENLSENEAMSQALKMQRKQGISKQIFFIFNPEDQELMHERAFTATLQSLDPLAYAYFDAMTFTAKIEEVQGGLLV